MPSRRINNNVTSDKDYDFKGSVYIQHAYNTRVPEFYIFNALTNSEVIWAYTLPKDSTWNVCYRNNDNNTYISWYPNLQIDDKVIQVCNIGVRYGVRCSTNGKAGFGYILWGHANNSTK